MSHYKVSLLVLLLLLAHPCLAANGVGSAEGVDLPIGAGTATAMIIGGGENVPLGTTEFLGPVGVGTSQPTTALDVIGTTRTRTIQLTDNVVAGTACVARSLGMSASGGLLTCQSGVWTKVGETGTHGYYCRKTSFNEQESWDYVGTTPTCSVLSLGQSGGYCTCIKVLLDY